jgi:hemolysin III
MHLNESFKRWTLGKMQNPVRGLLHGIAAVLSLVGTVLLVVRAENGKALIASIVFGSALLALYTTSSLYHSVPWREAWKRRMQRLDHAMIFVLIAATYTPMVLLMLGGWWQWVALSTAWGIALVGIIQRMLGSMDRHVLSFTLMLVQGWLAVPIMVPLASRAGTGAVVLIAIGGALYTVGMVFKVTGWPRLWPRVFSAHELFHVFVVAASALHWTATYRYVLGK